MHILAILDGREPHRSLRHIDGPCLLETNVNRDRRGHFVETWRESRFAAAGFRERFVQDNVSWSSARVLRGLHLQSPFGQGKLVSVPWGEIFDVAVDARFGSPTFGKWIGINLSDRNGRQLYIPAGYAHGFCVLSESALVSYKCTEEYHPEAEITVRWDDPRIGIRWPVAYPIVSERDSMAPMLDEIQITRLPKWGDGKHILNGHPK